MTDADQQTPSDLVDIKVEDNSVDVVFHVQNDSVMQNAFDVLSMLGRTNKVILKAKGNSIPNAVAVANIITEKMLKGNSEVQKITVNGENLDGISRMLSTIEIILLKRK